MIDVNLIPKNERYTYLKMDDVEVDDILSQIVAYCYHAKDQLRYFCDNLDYSDGYEGVFNFLKDNVRYRADSSKFYIRENVEVIKLPSRLISDAEGDCKSFTIFMSGVALNFDEDVYIRLVYYTKNLYELGMAHVYPFIKRGSKKYYLDVVNGKYNYQEPYYKKEDIKL